MSEARAAELAVLDAASSADPASPELDGLLANFGMQRHHRDKFLGVLSAGYWRKAKSPFNFVKSKVFAGDLYGDRDALGDADVHEGAMEHTRALFGPDRVAITADLTYDDLAVGYYEDHDESPAQRRGIERVHRSLLDWVPIDPTGEWSLSSRVQVNWKRVGERMGLDPNEILALQCMMGKRLSLRAALRLDSNQVRQRELRAAWARVERLQASGRLQRFLENPEISTGVGVFTCGSG